MMRSQKQFTKTTSGARSPSAPTISIIIPTRNEEKLLPKCLEQITPELRYAFRLEIIISDGGSTDDTIGIATAYADHIAVHQDPARRQTIAEGRNRGAQLASGDILMFLNADSRLADTKEFIIRVVQRFSLDPSLSAIAVKVRISPDEEKFSDTLFHGFFNQYVKWLNRFGIGMGRGECQIIRRSSFTAIGGYNDSLAAGEDFDLYYRINSLGKVRYDAKLLVYESPRRYRKFGYTKVYFDWVRNGFSVLFTRRSVSKVWEEVR